MTTTNSRVPRQLGKTGMSVLPIALGCYSMSSAYGKREDAESVQVIKLALDEGVRFIDTADFYGWGHNEGLVGAALKGRRTDAVLSTKFGYVREGDAYRVTGDPTYVASACEESLRRLGTDYVDLYFQHRLDPGVPIEDTVGAMSRLVESGKVRALGLCEVSPETLRRAHAVHPITCVQAEYSLWTRDVESGLAEACDELGVTLVPFSPLGRGMLTGKLRSLDDLAPDDVRRKYPRFSPENFAWNVSLVDQLADFAKKKNCSLAQLALAWLFYVNRRLVAVCGADTLSFLRENLGALDVSLGADDIAEISRLFSPERVAGDRYDARAMKLLRASRGEV